MPKRVAIIDIGSNSTRVVIYQRTSRFGFHLIAQKKSNLRISQGSFENNGELQESAIAKAINTLKSFQKIILDYKARKTLVVATAAVRNAPNKSYFLQRVRKEVGLNIKVINGDKEAFFGAVAVKNLLPLPNASLSVDIGGGSCDIALIKNGTITNTLSLNIGTITLKELFYDKNHPFDEIKKYIQTQLNQIPKSFEYANTAVAIGGVLRALSKSIIENSNYSYKKLHAFEYNVLEHKKHIKNIIHAKNNNELKELHISKNRYDTIRQGVLIFYMLLKHLKIENVITSSVGLREGLFLNDMLRGVGGKFPKELNPSIVSIVDRLDIIKNSKKRDIKILKELFNILTPQFNLSNEYLQLLIDAIKISNCGKTLTVYEEHKHTFYIATQELNWQYSHTDMLLIGLIVRSKKDKLLYKSLYKEHKKLLPSKSIIELLSFIYNLSLTLAVYDSIDNYSFRLENNNLTINSSKKIDLLKEDLKLLQIPKKITLKYQ